MIYAAAATAAATRLYISTYVDDDDDVSVLKTYEDIYHADDGRYEKKI